MKDFFRGDLGFRMDHAVAELQRARDEAIQRVKDTHTMVIGALKAGDVARGEVGRLEVKDADRVLVVDFRTGTWAPPALAIGISGVPEQQIQLAQPLEKETDYRAMVLLFKR